jgi:hypothetical protein
MVLNYHRNYQQNLLIIIKITFNTLLALDEVYKMTNEYCEILKQRFMHFKVIKTINN